MSRARRAFVATLLSAALVCAILPAPVTEHPASPAPVGAPPLDEAWSAGTAPLFPLAVVAAERSSPGPPARLSSLAAPPSPLPLFRAWVWLGRAGDARAEARRLAGAPQFARPPPSSVA